ncbi:MAG: hypothetical protein LCH76_10030 [Actinobacteria bacterium]|nr:hypothetical protein [Actinomycetota bacterium]
MVVLNPARALHELLTSWFHDLSRDAKTNRGYAGTPRPDVAADMRSGIRLLTAVEAAIQLLGERGRAVTVYERHLPALTFMINTWPNGWVDQPSSSIYDEAAMDILELLAHQIDADLLARDQLTEDALKSVVNEARSLLSQDDTLSPKLRWYLGRLFNEIDNALSDEANAYVFDLGSAIDRLWVAPWG